MGLFPSHLLNHRSFFNFPFTLCHRKSLNIPRYGACTIKFLKTKKKYCSAIIQKYEISCFRYIYKIKKRKNKKTENKTKHPYIPTPVSTDTRGRLCLKLKLRNKAFCNGFSRGLKMHRHFYIFYTKLYTFAQDSFSCN